MHERNRTGTLERSAIIRPRHPGPMEGIPGQQRNKQAAGKGSANRNENGAAPGNGQTLRGVLY